MANDMFCFQCEQTAKGTGCTGHAGVCGKTAEVANLQDALTQTLINLAGAVKQNPSRQAVRVMTEGLFATITNVNFDAEDIKAFIKKANHVSTLEGAEAKSVSEKTLSLWAESDDVRSLKSLILIGLRGVAAYAYHASALGYESDEVNRFFFEGLSAVGDEEGTMETLLPVVMKVGTVNLTCMELLDKANTQVYGTPTPVKVPLMVEKGPFIVITGHDLHDLHLLLEQTKDKGVNVYTHGEMLPAHAYPELKKYPQLKGNFGTAWQNQQKEFADVPAAFLFTTNCLMPVKESYSDRVFTTGVVGYPDMVYIGKDKDFTPVIDKALSLGGFDEDTAFTGINGGMSMTTGFGHGAVLSVADKVIDAVKTGAIRHFFLVGGCDGARTQRSYYTDFVKNTPDDTVVLTLACGKYRFNDLDLGEIGGLPRLMDMGQCNDAYSAIRVALALAEAFDCSVNELPLTLVLSWYEQKAVCILLTLLALGIKNIYLGPSLPAFVSPNVLSFLVENYGVTPTGDASEDLKKILG